MKQKSKSRTWLANLVSQKSATQDRKKQQGDTIAGQVEGSENVVIGKNVIQIGSLKIPRSIAILLAVVSGLVAIAATFLVYQSLPDTTMPIGSFNIGVAELVAYDVNENRIRPDEAYELSMRIASYLKGQKEILDPWINEGIEVWGPDQLAGRKSTQSIEEYTKEINADVLIYGTLYEKEVGIWEIKPEFYLPDEVVRQAEELRGEHALGTAINYSDNRVEIGEVNTTLRIRIKALVQILMSLSNIALGSEDNYREAVNIMEEAIQNPEWGAAGDNTGQEILYLFLGNTYMSIAAQATEDAEDERIALLIQSRDAFSTAIALNSNYARAYNGLGFALYQSILKTPEVCLPETSDAISQKFKTALELPDHAKPESGNVDYRANWGLSRVAFLKVMMCGDTTAVAEAQKYYGAVIKEFTQITEKFDDLTDMAIAAYIELGLIKFAQSLDKIPLDTGSNHEDTLSGSIENFKQALNLSSRTVESEGYTNYLLPFYLQSLCMNNQTEYLHQVANEYNQSPDALDKIQLDIDSKQWEECKNGF